MRQRIGSPALSSRGKTYQRSAHRWAVGLLALLAAGLVIGASHAAAGSDPDWLASDPENVSQSTLNLAWQPNIATTASGEMVVAWSDQRAGVKPGDEPRYLYTITSEDDGRTWTTTPMTVAVTGEGYSLAPNLLVVQDRLFIVWGDGQPPSALYEAERIAPDTWEKREIPSPVPLINAQSDVIYGAGQLHVVFGAGNNNVSDILYAARPLTATTWPTASVAFTHTQLLGSANPRLVISPDETALHMVWEERASSSSRAIMYMSGSLGEGGVSWNTPTQLSGGVNAFWPDIVGDSQGNLYVVWGEKGTEGSYVRYAYRDAAAGSWTIQGQAIDDTPVKVNELLPTDIIPRLALREEDGGARVCVVWYGFRDEGLTSPAEEVLLSCSSNGGQIWSVPVNVSRTSGEEDISIAPVITFDAQEQLHCVWQEHIGDRITRNYEIYHTYAYFKLFMPLVIKHWS